MTEDEMVGWHHWPNRHEFEQTLREGDGQGNLQPMGSQRVGHDSATEQLLDNHEHTAPSLLEPKD